MAGFASPRALAVAVTLAAVVTVNAAAVKVTTKSDKKADFQSLRVYTWLPTPPYINNTTPEFRDPLLVPESLDAPIRSAVDAALAGRRYSVADPTAAPDFFVVYYAAFGTVMNADVLGSHYTYLTGWGSPLVGATPTTSLNVIEQGTLVVDIVRRDRKIAIWRGMATGAVDRTRAPEERRRTIDDAVKKMFAKFPSRRE